MLIYKLTPLSLSKIGGHTLASRADKYPPCWLAFKRQSSMKSPCRILRKGVLEPLTHACTDLNISKESNVLIQEIVM